MPALLLGIGKFRRAGDDGIVPAIPRACKTIKFSYSYRFSARVREVRGRKRSGSTCPIANVHHAPCWGVCLVGQGGADAMLSQLRTHFLILLPEVLRNQPAGAEAKKLGERGAE